MGDWPQEVCPRPLETSPGAPCGRDGVIWKVAGQTGDSKRNQTTPDSLRESFRTWPRWQGPAVDTSFLEVVQPSTDHCGEHPPAVESGFGHGNVIQGQSQLSHHTDQCPLRRRTILGFLGLVPLLNSRLPHQSNTRQIQPAPYPRLTTFADPQRALVSPAAPFCEVQTHGLPVRSRTMVVARIAQATPEHAG